MSEQVRWIFPGHHPLGGTKTGINEVVDFFDLMAAIMKKSFARAKKLVVGSNDEDVVESQHIWMTVDGMTSEHYWCVLGSLKTGRLLKENIS
jgi:uncharacterized protein